MTAPSKTSKTSKTKDSKTSQTKETKAAEAAKVKLEKLKEAAKDAKKEFKEAEKAFKKAAKAIGKARKAAMKASEKLRLEKLDPEGKKKFSEVFFYTKIPKSKLKGGAVAIPLTFNLEFSADPLTVMGAVTDLTQIPTLEADAVESVKNLVLGGSSPPGDERKTLEAQYSEIATEAIIGYNWSFTDLYQGSGFPDFADFTDATGFEDPKITGVLYTNIC